ncbi:MFS transporter [Nocardioides sp. zg-578]|nr:MFS transporter [Nocardioides marmotae]MTB85558.1 MFS transporter [Nocardioides marmotae]
MPGMRHAFRALRHRDFAIFWSASIASSSGTWLQNLAVPWVLFQLTGSALWVGLATAALSIPMVLASPAGGALADSNDPRRVLVVTQSLMALVALLQCLNWLYGIREPWAVLCLVVLVGLLNGLTQPSWQSLVNRLVPREDLRSAVTLNSMQINVAKAVGPATAGVVLAVAGAWAAFLVNALTFVAVLVGLLVMRADTRGVRLEHRVTALRGLVGAGGYVLRHPALRLTLICSTLIGLLGYPVLTFTIVMAEEAWDVGSTGMGALNVALGLGAVAMGPVLAGWERFLPRGTVMRFGLPIYGAAVLCFGLSPSFGLALVALVVAGAGFFSASNSNQTAAQMIVAESMRGRVLALKLMTFMVAASVGSAVQGAVADAVGPRVTIATAGALLIVVAAVLHLLPARIGLARLDDPQDTT